MKGKDMRRWCDIWDVESEIHSGAVFGQCAGMYRDSGNVRFDLVRLRLGQTRLDSLC